METGEGTMRKITGTLTEDLKNHIGENDISRHDAFPVNTYRELMKHVAQLSYINKDHLLFFRGQANDYINKAGASTFYPSIYRGERTTKQELETRFEILSGASKRLADSFIKQRIDGAADVKKRRYIQWSILQHYEVCPTPLMDFSQSVRVACSFAFLNNVKKHAYIFVFGLPYLTNRISINSEHDLVNVRLLSICPPDALRPYYQEGYLAGTDDSTIDFVSKDEFDFNARLIAKFKIPISKTFWSTGFSPIPEIALYPKGDRIHRLCQELSKELGTETEPGQLGLLLQAWVNLESHLLTLSRSRGGKVYSAPEAIKLLRSSNILDSQMSERIDRIRKIRNDTVHSPEKTTTEQLISARAEIEKIINTFSLP